MQKKFAVFVGLAVISAISLIIIVSSPPGEIEPLSAKANLKEDIKKASQILDTPSTVPESNSGVSIAASGQTNEKMPFKIVEAESASRTASKRSSRTEKKLPASMNPTSYKDKHIAALKKAKLIASEVYQNEKGQTVLASHVKSTKMLGSDQFIVREYQPTNSDQKPTAFVEIADHIILKFNKKITDDKLKKIANQFALSKPKPILLENTFRFTINQPSIKKRLELEDRLKAHDDVSYAQGNYISYSLAKPNDEMFDGMWGLENEGLDPNGQPNPEAFIADIDIQASTAWDFHTDCSSVPVAILDTGILPTHPDLEANILANTGRNFTSEDINAFVDGNGHGTHVAGTVGAVGNNSIGVSGVCWKAALIPVKVLNDAGAGSSEGIVNGLLYTATTNAKVLNMSLGGGPRTQADIDAFARLRAQGVLSVIAAGNETNNNDTLPTYPASYEDVSIISVAAIDGTGEMALFSNWGATTVDIAAPGQAVLSTWSNLANPPELYLAIPGTSMAAPHVAGAVALLWSYQPELTPEQVKAEILGSSLTRDFLAVQNAEGEVFPRSIAGNRILDLSRVINTVQATVNLDASTTTFQARDTTEASLKVSVAEKYNEITKVEVFFGEELIGSSEGLTDEVKINLPIGAKAADLVVVITDDKGRTFSSETVTFELDIEKSVGLTGIEALGLEGAVQCEIAREVEGDRTVLHQVRVETVRACQKFCDIMGPLVYSSQAEIVCTENSQLIYSHGKQ